MASTYVNDLRLNEMATGDGSGTWGTTTNTNLELIAEAFSYGTEAITTNADTHTTTIADGATDPGRSLYLKYTGTLDSACTITIGPNTVSKVWIVENGTSGSQNIILSQGSGANITIPAGDTKVVYSDGAGAGAAFFDAFASINVGDLTAGTLTVGSGSVTDSSGAISFGNENLTTTGIVTAAGTSVFTNLDISGDVDVDGTLETDNLTVGGAQGTDGQVLTSTGSGVAWEDAPAGGPTFKTFGTGSIMVGDDATGTIDAADNNTGLGVDVFAALTSGDGNTAVGGIALDAITTSSDNTAVGHESLTNATSGAGNTALGKGTMTGVVTGSNNVAVGRYALSANTSASNNVAVGINALVANTTGASNTAVGAETLAANTEGSNNVAVGVDCLKSVTTGGTNVAIGYHAGDSITTAGGNVFIGTNAGQSATTSIYPNIGIGTNAMYSVTDGYQNIAIGYRSGESCTAIGNTFMGDSAGMQVTTGNGNVCYGIAAGYNITTGDNNTLIGNYVGFADSPGGAITTGSNILVLGNQNITNSHIQVDWTVASDKRDKTDVAPLDMGLSFINKLEPVTYKWDKRSNYVERGEEFKDLITDGTHKETWTDVGFLAQDVEKLESEFGHNIADETNLTTHLSADKNQYGLTYSKFIPMLVKAVQELSTQVEELKSELLALKGE
jgi:hypothetical protein